MSIKKVLIPRKVEKKEKREKFYIKDNADVHTKNGVIKKEQLKDGEIIRSHMGKEFYLIPAGFKDSFENIKRDAQIIIPKDFGVIVAETGINKDTIIVEAGTGSGGLACLFANVAKEVWSYDVADKAVEIGRKNAKFLGLDNVHFDICNLKEKAPKKNVDVVVLDMPEAERAIESSFKMLKLGGWLVGYFPQITQAKDFVLALEGRFVVEKISETIEREWKITERIARPNFLIQGHTAFLVFARKATR